MNSDFDRYYEAAEPGRRERAYAWATAIGLQDVDGLKPSEYLVSTAKRHIEGEISQDEARRLVDEYYETKEGHDLPADMQEADKVSARIVAVINSPTFNLSVPYYLGLHRQDVGMNDVINRRDDVINDAINFSEAEKVAINAILRDPKLSAARLADILGVKQRQAQRIVASLKKKTNLTRCGARKNGEWRFGSGGMASGSSSSSDSRISGAARTSSPEKGNLIE